MDLHALIRDITEQESAPLGGPRVRVLPVGSSTKGVAGPVRVRQPEGMTTKQMLKEHPATLAAGVAALAMPQSALAMGALGAFGRAVDKFHPLTDQPSDYTTEEPGEAGLDVILAGLTQGVLSKLGPRGKAREPEVSDAGLRQAISARKPILSRVTAPERPEVPYVNVKDKLIDPPLDYRLPPGYKIHNYDYEGYQGLRDLDAAMEAAGLPRFIDAPKGSGFEGFRVGNPDRNMHLDFPEGKSYAQARATADPAVPIDERMYSGVASSDPNPYFAYNPKPGRENHLKWGSSDRAVAKSYMQPKVYDPAKWREMVRAKIKSGEINKTNLPEGISSVDELKVVLNDHRGSDVAAKLLRGQPEMSGLVQDLVPFHKSVKQYDLAGGHWSMRSQIRDLLDAQLEGRDAIQYLRSRDAGPFRFQLGPGEHSNTPSNVTVSLDPTRLKSAYNLGTWDLRDPRLLASLVGGLGIGGGTELPRGGGTELPDATRVTRH